MTEQLNEIRENPPKHNNTMTIATSSVKFLIFITTTNTTVQNVMLIVKIISSKMNGYICNYRFTPK